MANTQILWNPSPKISSKSITIGKFPINGHSSIFSNRSASSQIKVNKDLLAISCHLWRNFKDNWEKRYLNLKEASNTLNLTQIDYDNAELVADYFSKYI
jgi:hypothetical protein